MNIFLKLPVPLADGPGESVAVGHADALKTFICVGDAFPGRYLIEGSHNGTAWDVLEGPDGLGASFLRSSTPKTLRSIVAFVRVRSVGNIGTAWRPSISMGAARAMRRHVFDSLTVAPNALLGRLVDLGPDAGVHKTFIARGKVPLGARYRIEGSHDGQAFDTLMTVSADQRGARTLAAICRYLRVTASSALDTFLDVTVGAESFPCVGEGLPCPPEKPPTESIVLTSDRAAATSTMTEEETLFEFPVGLDTVGADTRAVDIELTALALPLPAGSATFRAHLLAGPATTSDCACHAVSVPFTGAHCEGSLWIQGDEAAVPVPRHDGPFLVRVTAQGDGTNRPGLQSVSVVLRPR